MKNVKFKSISLLSLTIVGLSACNPLAKMVKNAEKLAYSVEPTPVAMAGDTVTFAIKGKFPEQFFFKKATVEITPVIKFPSDDPSPQMKELAKVNFIGDAAEGEGNKVSYATGGSFTKFFDVAYEKGMDVASIELRATASFKSKTVNFPDVKVGDGTIITSKLVEGDDRVILASDKFQKTEKLTYNADIHYLINSPSVRSSELNASDVKKMMADISGSKDAGITLKSVNIEAYASPDGELTKNENLANDRASSAAKVITSSLKKNKIEGVTVNKVGKGEDWDGFKSELNGSDINPKDKKLIINILEMTSDLAKRENEIKQLSKTYLEVADKVLPTLRRSQIVINAEKLSKTDEEIKSLASSNPDSLTVEELLYASSLTEDMNEKLTIYQSVSKVYPEDWRGPNNVGYVMMQQNKLSDAKAEFVKAEKAAGSNAVVKNNLGVCSRLMGDRVKAREMYTGATSAGSDVNYNLGIVDIMDGNFDDAVTNFAGSNSFNAALAKVLNGDPDGGLGILDASDDKNSAQGYYLKAVIGARKNSKDMVVNNLKSAISKESSYKTKAARDAEFLQFKENSEFQKIVQ